MYSINPNKETFEEFILRVKEGLVKDCFIKTNCVVKTIFGERLESSTTYNTNIIKKWSVIVENSFKNLNLSYDYKNLICLYCEVITIYYHYQSGGMVYGFQGIYSQANFNMSSELAEIYNNIISKRSRAKIVDKYYNFKNGMVEYLLDTGDYVSEDSSKNLFDIDYSVFPAGFLLLVDSSEYRNSKIDQITNG